MAFIEPNRGPKHPTVRVPGLNAEDMNITGFKSVKNARLSARSKPRIPGISSAGVTGGFVSTSDIPTPIRSNGQINQRHARRRMAKVQKNNGRIYW